MMNSSQQLLQPGTPCTLHGLQGQPAFNGNTVSILEFLHDQGRYRVQPMDPNSPLPPVLAIKPQNLQPLGAPNQHQPPVGQFAPQSRGPPMGQLFPPGARFILQGLQAQPTFNGQHVLIMEYLHDQERYRVQPADPNGPLPPVLAIRSQNLVPADAGHPMGQQQGQFPPGSRFVLQGLQAQPTFNGQHVLIMEYLHDQERYRVQPADPNGPLPPVLAIRPQNLVPAGGGGRSAGPSGGGGGRNAGTPMGQHQGQFPPGARFMLQGLQAQPTFNGQHVLIMEYLHDQERYRVQPADPNGPLPPVLAIRPQNLVPTSASGGLSKQQSTSRSLLKLWKKQSKSKQEVHQPPPPDYGMQRSMSVPSISMMIPPEISVPQNDDISGVESESLSPGSTAVLHGLKTQRALNGQMVVIVEYMQDEGRYSVKPVDPTDSSMPVIAIKPQNLLPCKDPRRQKQKYASEASTNCPSQTSGSRSSSSASSPSVARSNAWTVHFKPGCRARITGLKAQPALNGHMVRIVEYLQDQDRYRVEPSDVEAQDVCTSDIMLIRPRNLTRVDPAPAGAEALAPGTRAVLANLTGMASLNGQLVTVVKYLAGNGSYEVRPLGREAQKAAPAKSLFLGPNNLKTVPQSAFWVRMTIKGRRLRLPVSCKVVRDKIGQSNVHVLLDAFAGLDQVIPAAKVILGEDHCDWMDDGEVIAALEASKSQTITYDIRDPDAHVGLKRSEAFISKDKQTPMFEAMVDFELIKKTQKTVDVELLGSLSVYKLTFPVVAEKKTKAKDLETKRPHLQKSQSTRSVRSSKTKAKDLEMKRPHLQKSQSTRSVRSSKSLRSSKSRLSTPSLAGTSSSGISSCGTSSSGTTRSSRLSIQDRVDQSEWKRQSLSVLSSSRSSKGRVNPSEWKRQSQSSSDLKRSLSRRSHLSRSSKSHSERHLPVISKSDQQLRPDPPCSDNIQKRSINNCQADPVGQDSMSGAVDVQLNVVAATRDSRGNGGKSQKLRSSSHSPTTVVRKVVAKDDEDEDVLAKSPRSRSSSSHELDMQDLFVRIEAKESEKKELEKSIQKLDQQLSLVQVTCVAASQKLKLLRGQVDVSVDDHDDEKVSNESGSGHDGSMNDGSMNDGSMNDGSMNEFNE